MLQANERTQHLFTQTSTVDQQMFHHRQIKNIQLRIAQDIERIRKGEILRLCDRCLRLRETADTLRSPRMEETDEATPNCNQRSAKKSNSSFPFRKNG